MNLKIDLPLDRLKKYYIDENHTQKECCEFFNISLNALQRRINLYNLKKDQQSINNRRKDTCYQKYGVEYVGQAKQFQEKAQDTMLKRYGVKGAAGLSEVQKTIKQNNLSKYGVDHPMKSVKGKEHFKKIMEQKYGVSNPSQCSDFQQKKKDSCLQHYGVENPSQSEEIKRKKEKTNLKHYGVECNLTLDSTKEQIRQTCIQKYGMPCPPVSKYKIDGISFDSSWEAALYIYARDHHEEIKRCPTRIFYKYEGKDHYTVPDFLYKGELIEIKGDHFLKDGSLINIYNRDNDGQSNAKYEAAVQHGVKFWYEKDIRFALDYVKKQYSSDFLEQYKKSNMKRSKEGELMIYFYDIFEKAFSLFSDPDIDRKYYEDQAGFQSDMLDYLMVGKNKFTYPTAITDKLLICDEAQGFSEVDSGNGSDTYELQTSVPHDGEKVGFTFAINGKPVHGQYNPDDNTVTFDRAVLTTETWGVSWFYAGAFSADFSNCLRSDFPMDAIMEKVTTILAYATLSVWGDKEVGRVLEVRNILTDTDFKMYSPANSARAKVEWRNQMNRDMDTLVSELNWRIMSTPRGGSRFGK